MSKAQEAELSITDQESKGGIPHQSAITARPLSSSRARELKWWIQITIFIVFVLAGQSAAMILGRLYFAKGGKSIWMATLLQIVGFPALLPMYYCFRKKTTRNDVVLPSNPPSAAKLVSVYVSLGILVAVECVLYSIGLLYLPVSTYSLICASQLAFNGVFSFYLNGQKFTPYILNSLVLLTISSTLLVFHTDSSSNSTGGSGGKYGVGFVCTVAASALFSLVLSLTQLAFQRVIKPQTFKAVLDMIIYQSLVASCVTVVGLLASGQWRTIRTEMAEFELGSVSYLMTVIWIALTWQIYAIGAVGLIAEVSSLFSNAVSTFGLPIIPVLAVIFFHDNMDGIKVVAMVLAMWGFVSYGYHHYLADYKTKKKTQSAIDDAPKASGV
ncbi:hypothetical protein Nepgr_032154 [Nepenthes gracilis]|uniref:Probable purine permease n=1 Tax=Nepenthes gracilis TaxID=150966 RepID=A0AAD3TJH2_NEPGR|nr:hypothetical protein Nepgr_032154 [Nepenthes gracilis]